MKGLIAFSIIIIFVNCQYCVRNESMTLTPNSESHYIQERLFHNDVIEDSLESFIKDVGPDSYSNTVYTIDFAKYKSDTLISFMAYKHVLLDSTYFFVDSRALLEIKQDPQILINYEWASLNERINGKPLNFRLEGTQEVNDSTLIVITSRNVRNIEKFVINPVLNLGLVDKYAMKLIEDDDRKPYINIYKYVHKDSLQLIYIQSPEISE